MKIDATPDERFQSLLGFLMRCDEVESSILQYAYTVSIPAGFSDALRPDARFSVHPMYVSIPAGFSDALRHGSAIHNLAYPRFNPCWVF